MAIMGAHSLYIYETIYIIPNTYKLLQISERMNGTERTTVTENEKNLTKNAAFLRSLKILFSCKCYRPGKRENKEKCDESVLAAQGGEMEIKIDFKYRCYNLLFRLRGYDIMSVSEKNVPAHSASGE